MSSILIADDSKVFADALGASLRREGFQVFVARDGVEALNILRYVHVDVVLLDLSMEPMSGMEFLRAARCDPRYASTPAIVVTGDDNPQVSEKVWGMGIKDLLRKGSFSVGELVGRVREVITEQSERFAALAAGPQHLEASIYLG
jgi:two-component system chemotaxis response regulator CheY